MIDTDKVKHRMSAKFLDGAMLAEKVGVSRNSIYRMLRGETQPRPATLKAICEALECEADDLLKEVG